jgi:hypothetical protein
VCVLLITVSACACVRDVSGSHPPVVFSLISRGVGSFVPLCFLFFWRTVSDRQDGSRGEED